MKGPARLALGLFVALMLVGRAAPGQEATESCSITTPELDKALDAVHAARDGSAAESERVVKEWLPRVTQVLASDRKVLKEWLHVAVDLGRELTRLERTDEAHKLFSRVAKLDPKGEWGKKAATHMKDLDGRQ